MSSVSRATPWVGRVDGKDKAGNSIVDAQVSVTERVLDVVREVLVVPDVCDLLRVSIRDELAATSLEQLTLFVALEDEFDRRIPQEEVRGIDTIAGIIAYLENRIGHVHGEAA